MPDAPDIPKLLAALPLFAQLDRGILARIADGSRLRSYAAGELIVREREACRGFFAVHSGGVRVYRLTPDGREQVLHRLRGGQTFAEAALLTMGFYPANAVATETPTEVVEIGGETFMRVFESDPRIAKTMVSSLAMWLLRLVGRVEELSVSSAGARLARYLLDLPSTAADGKAVIELPLAKKDLAAYLGITPETLSRLLRKWQDRELIESGGREITVLDTETLLAIADDAGGAD